MTKRPQTEPVRLRLHTKRALMRVAYNPPFCCRSIGEFLAMVERGDPDAIAAWQRVARELLEEDA